MHDEHIDDIRDKVGYGGLQVGCPDTSEDTQTDQNKHFADKVMEF